jgi:hypothetical protein
MPVHVQGLPETNPASLANLGITMDTHITGPRGKNSKGAVLSALGVRVGFGDAAQTGKEIFRTTGAGVKTPIFVRVTGKINTAFDATGVVAKITSTNLDGTGAADVATLAGLTAMLMLTVDKIFLLVYTVGTGGTAGEAGYFIECAGAGIPQAP